METRSLNETKKNQITGAAAKFSFSSCVQKLCFQVLFSTRIQFSLTHFFFKNRCFLYATCLVISVRFYKTFLPVKVYNWQLTVYFPFLNTEKSRPSLLTQHPIFEEDHLTVSICR